MTCKCFGFFREFRETQQLPSAADTAVLGWPSLAQPMETGMNGTTETGRQRKVLAAQARCHGVQRRAREPTASQQPRLPSSVALPFESTVRLPFPEKRASVTGAENNASASRKIFSLENRIGHRRWCQPIRMAQNNHSCAAAQSYRRETRETPRSAPASPAQRRVYRQLSPGYRPTTLRE